MAAPTVTRPLPSVTEPDTKTSTISPETEKWVKWAIIGVIAAGLIALITVVATTLAERSRVNTIRSQWDEVFLATKELEKKTPDEKIKAYAAAAEKVRGTPAGAYALMQAADLSFEESLNNQKLPDQRRVALDEAVKMYDQILADEKLRTNAAFGPLAIERVALAHAQRQDYDSAIKFLTENMAEPEHFLHNKMQGELAIFYYLRSLKKDKEGKDGNDDREKAREKIRVVETGVAANASSDEIDTQLRRYDKAFLDQLNYIKQMIARPGKALPGGKAPPVKAAVEPEKKDGEKKDDSAKEAPKADATPVEPTKQPEPAKPAEPTKPTEVKK
jgi:predicted negative regulator of RcsB-dependent stress response